ncbi:MAG TPA: DUF2303 family protein [Methylibium sp.]|nr:DUF2303 family protein [Methylibium sp.]
MFDKEAIKELSRAEAISAAETAIKGAMESDGLAALPGDFEIHDIEKHLPTRRRLRGSMQTAVIDHFASYVGSHAESGATVFVDKARMQAVAVLNLGNPDSPGHADNVSVLAPDKTAAYIALGKLLSTSFATGLSQRDLAEFMEDWEPAISCIDADGSVMSPKKAIDAVRRITIDTARKVESTEGQLSAERSALEKVAASSGGNPLPATITFKCDPYFGLSGREFGLRLSVRTGDVNKPALALALRLVKAEEHAEQMASELAALVTEAIGGKAPVYVGSYSAKA